MKKFVISFGVAALGASAVHAADVPGTTANMTKPWSVSATLRGFYDDNVNTATKDKDPTTGLAPKKQDSFGFEISPSFALQWAPTAQTHASLAYFYSFIYYDRKPDGNSDHFDQTHTLNAALEHAFSERYQLVVGDSFVVGQEPDLLRAQNALATEQRISGNNIRNYGSIAFKAQLTRLFGLEVGYNNALYDYADHASSDPAFNPTGHGDPADPSNSGRLDRLEHTIHLDTRWIIQPETVGIFGYQYRFVDYTANEVIGATTDTRFPDLLIRSDNRNYREHYIYLGADHSFRPDLAGSLRLGGRYIEFYNDPTGNGNGWGPYAMANLVWTYAPDSRFEIGVSQDINSSDVVGSGDFTSGTNNTFTSSTETTVVYASINHRITTKLRGSLLGQFQNSFFKGGAGDGKSERDFLVGLNFTYQFTPHFSSEVGYNYDYLKSEIAGRTFDRNRVYIGATASY